jgi:hypothetical protein
MNVPLREGLLALVTLSISPACAGSSVPGTGFRFCPTPVPPTCIDDDRAYDSEPEIKDCQEKVSRYAASVFAYRTCLLHETQRAVLETNTMIDRFKCGAKSKRRCSNGEVRQNK